MVLPVPKAIEDSTVAVGQMVDALIVQVVPCPLSYRQVLMVQTLQKTVEVPQLQLVDSTSLSWCKRQILMVLFRTIEILQLPTAAVVNYLVMQLQFLFLPELILHKYSVEG